MYKENISFFEKIIAAASYITFGTVGFIWLLVVFFTKSNLSSYLRYHTFQSVFISIFYFIVSALLGLIMQILSIIPVINQISSRIYFSLNMPVFYGFSIINAFIYIIVLYLVITCIQGKYSYLPWISDIINENFRR